MKIDFKKPKYVLPIILLPFSFLLNYSLQSFYLDKANTEVEGLATIQEGIGDVSDQIRNRGIDDKLDAFRSRYKSADGYTAIKNLRIDVDDQAYIESQYNEKEKRMLDSIDHALRYSLNQPQNLRGNATTQYERFQPNNAISKEDEELLKAIEQLQGGSRNAKTDRNKYEDPMDLFRAQMTLIDSISKANDPNFQQTESVEKQITAVDEQPKAKVNKADNVNEHFNTVSKMESNSFIKAIIDEDIEKGSLGGRLRLRLLEDIQVGPSLLVKGTYLYALISGYEAQRVKLHIRSVMVGDKLHPVQLSVYDQDGMEGLYIPINTFRQFSKDLGGNATGGMNMQMQQDPGSMNQFYMSTLQRIFTSTSQAMSKNIRQNKANLKYGTFIYLIDPDDLVSDDQNVFETINE